MACWQGCWEGTIGGGRGRFKELREQVCRCRIVEAVLEGVPWQKGQRNRDREGGGVGWVSGHVGDRGSAGAA